MPAAAKYEPTWDSLRQYRVPEWFKDAKLGIFIHWGVYCVPAYDNEWYPRSMYLKGNHVHEHHRKKWGAHKDFGYKDFIPMFKAERWDPSAIVALFKEAGAKYVVPVAEHHDGFPMYNCSFTPWNAARMGPCRDIVAELAAVVRCEGLKLGVSSHRAFNWKFYTFAEEFDNGNPDYSKLYGVPHPAEAPIPYEFVLDWHGRTRELIDLFKPDLLWFDFCWHRDEYEPFRPRVAAYYYNRAIEWGREVVLNYKDKFPSDTAVFDIERGKLNEIRKDYWQTDTSISLKSWCYIEDDEFRSVPSLVHDLVDIASKNGNLLLNVGPKPDGTLPEEVVERLRGLGRWLKLNGEAVYGTRCWQTFGEGPTGIPASFREKEQMPYSHEDIRFTVNGKRLYATCFGWPGEKCAVKTLRKGGPLAADAIAAISMLGSAQKLPWSQDEKGLTIATPREQPGEHAFVFKIDMK